MTALCLWRQRKRTWVTSVLFLLSTNHSLNLVLTHLAIFSQVSFPPFFKNTLSFCFTVCAVIFVLFICFSSDMITSMKFKTGRFSLSSGHYYYSFPFPIMTENNILQKRQMLQKGSTPDVTYSQYTLPWLVQGWTDMTLAWRTDIFF